MFPLYQHHSFIATLAPLQKKFTLLKSQLELKTYDLSLFEGQAEQSEHHKLADAVVSLTSEFQNENKELVKKDEEHQEYLKTVEAFKKSLKDHGQDRENQLQALEKEIKPVAHCCHNYEYYNAGSGTAHEKLIMEKDAAIQEMQALGIELSASQQQITKLEEAIGEVEAKVRESALRLQEVGEMTIGTLTTKLTSVYWIVVNCFIHLFCLIPPIELILPHISGDTSNM
ncbi:unnamed protein product [Sphagnum jensenii]|uniref:Uncharacterized protein n=1 Tax=Sphagnum jensenii TaxID=128206 RepID=A0ABP0WH18_9BRYO